MKERKLQMGTPNGSRRQPTRSIASEPSSQTVLRFVRETQPTEWSKIEALHVDKTGEHSRSLTASWRQPLCNNLTIVPYCDEALSLQTAQVFIEFVSQRFIFMCIGTEDLDGFDLCCGHRCAPLQRSNASTSSKLAEV